MTSQQIQERREKLVGDYQKNEQAFETARLMREALHGAIQDCDHWLKVIAAEEETARLEMVDITKQVNENLLRMPASAGQPDTDPFAEAEQREAVREMEHAAQG